MNIYNKFLSVCFLALVLSLASCNVLDVKPEYLLTKENAFQKIEDLESGLLSTYGNMRGAVPVITPDILADDIRETEESLGGLRLLHNWQYSVENGSVAGAWAGPYAAINRINTVLASIDLIKDKNEDWIERKQLVKGQLLVGRAYMHFILLQYFAESYERNSTAWGVTVKTTADLTFPKRNKVNEVYDQIYQDMDEAEKILAGKTINGKGPRRKFDEFALYALRARVSLYASNRTDATLLSDAAKYATKVIDSGVVTLGVLDGAEGNQYSTVFISPGSAASNNEVIMAFGILSVNEGRIGDAVHFTPNDRASFAPSFGWKSLFDATNPQFDVRYNLFGATPGSVEYIVLNVKKRDAGIVSKYSYNKGAVDVKAFRLSEMYLIRAEVAYLQSDEAAALKDLNLIRRTRIRGYTDVSISGLAVEQAIKTERRKELFLEGHRFFDIKRYGESIVRDNKDVVAPVTEGTLDAGNRLFTFPIPRAEILANPGYQQTKGY